VAGLRQRHKVEGLEKGENEVDDLGREREQLVLAGCRRNASYGGATVSYALGSEGGCEDAVNLSYLTYSFGGSSSGSSGKFRRTPTAISYPTM
jgi:hypothetical protein